jgi:putative chitinase
MSLVTTAQLLQLCPRANKQLAQLLPESLSHWLAQYDIDTPNRVRAFMAQAAHETDGFRTLREYASGQAYEGRADLGNDKPGDGRRYKGRGIFQLTGRANYRLYGQLLHLALEAQPDMAAQPDVSVQIACMYWQRKNLSHWANNGDLTAITRAINGGLNGLTDRQRLYSLAKTIWR